MTKIQENTDAELTEIIRLSNDLIQRKIDDGLKSSLFAGLIAAKRELILRAEGKVG